MKTKKLFKKVLSCIICFVLITAIALIGTACQNNPQDENPKSSEAQTVAFIFEVVDEKGNKETFDIETTEKTVGAALLKEGIIEGEEGPYGLYVKKVNGVFAEYETTGTYWSFYVNGQYATSGADKTEIVPGQTYSFKVEKA